MHTCDGADSSDVGFVALECKTFVLLGFKATLSLPGGRFVLLGFETTLSLPGGGFVLELRPTYKVLEMCYFHTCSVARYASYGRMMFCCLALGRSRGHLSLLLQNL